MIKTGLGPGLIQLMEEGWVTALALNGAGAIHDLELAFFGRTSEDVAEQLPEGRFGMARETSLWINRWTVEAADGRRDWAKDSGGPTWRARGREARRSVLASAYRLGIPATVHLSIGPDINHQHAELLRGSGGRGVHPRLPHSLPRGRALGARAWRSTLARPWSLPEVFLKAVSVATNLGNRFTDLTTAVFDFQKQYRPTGECGETACLQGGRGYYLVGHHEILLPLFFQALLWEGQRGAPRTADAGRGGRQEGVARGAVVMAASSRQEPSYAEGRKHQEGR